MKTLLHILFTVLVLAELPSAAYSQSFAPGACSLVPASKTCIDATPCKTDSSGNTVCLAGVTLPTGAWGVPQTCWQYSYSYACSGATVDTCTPYENNKACSLMSSVCSDTVPSNGSCGQYDYTYNCITQPAQTSQVMSCTNSLFNTSAIQQPKTIPSTLTKAAIATQVVTQASEYNTYGGMLFSGVVEQCKKGWGGLKDCCKSAGGAKSNSAIMNMVFSTGSSAVKYLGEKAVDLASPYVFDAMYQSGQYTAGLMSSLAAVNSANMAQNSEHLLTGTTFASNGLTLGAYGFTYGTGNFAAYQSSSMIGGNINLSESFGLGEGDGFVSFNPYVFAAMVAVQIIQDLASCEQGEQMLSMHKGASLSVFVSESCSAKIPIVDVCIEWTDHYCSFNSVLSKIINTQGKPQLGLSLADCTGLSTDQLGKLDFNKIDFTEFAATQAANAKANLPTNIKGNYTPIVQGATKGSSQSVSPALPSYPSK